MTTTARFLAACTLWLLAMTAGAQAVLHRISVNVQLSADYAIVTEVRDLTPGGVDEGFVPIASDHLVKKFIMNVSTDDKNYFQRLDWWKSSAPTAEKQRKCGRKWIDDGHALYCWGIDPSERARYFVSYPLRNVLYNDGKNDVLDYDFVNLASQAPAEVAVVRVYLKEGSLKADDLDLGHSSQDVDIAVANGVVTVAPKAAGQVSNMPLRLAFRSGLFDGLPVRMGAAASASSHSYSSSGGGGGSGYR